MRKFRIILISLLTLFDIYLLYSVIGYLIFAIKTPDIIGDTTTQFGGMYFMSLFSFIFFVINSLFIIFIALKLRKQQIK